MQHTNAPAPVPVPVPAHACACPRLCLPAPVPAAAPADPPANKAPRNIRNGVGSRSIGVLRNLQRGVPEGKANSTLPSPKSPQGECQQGS